MTNENLNKRIATVIESLPKDYRANPEEVSFFRRYDGCDDFLLSDALIDKIWGWFEKELLNYGVEGDRDIPGAVSILHTNSGAGKVLEKAPKNSLITAYNIDYTCKRITDFVCQKRAEEGMYFCAERDISQYFALCNTNSSRKYSVVITQPASDMTFYKGIDFDRKIEDKDPLEYYATRAAHFVDENGYLVVIYEPNKADEVRKIAIEMDMSVQKTIDDKEHKYLAYEAGILRKNK